MSNIHSTIFSPPKLQTAIDDYLLSAPACCRLPAPTPARMINLPTTDVSTKVILKYFLSQLIYGIFGVIKLLSGPHLIVVSGRARVGVLMGHTVWKVTATEVFPYKKTTMHLNESQVSLLLIII